MKTTVALFILLTVFFLTPSAESISFSPDGQTVAIGADNTIRLYDVSTGKLKTTLEGHKNDVDSVLFSPDGKTLASGSQVREAIHLWDVATGAHKVTLDEDVPRFNRINGMLFSPDSKTLATVRAGMIGVFLWDVATGTHKMTLEGYTNSSDSASFGDSIAFSPDGKTLVSGSRERVIPFWDVSTGKLKTTLEGHAGEVTSVAFSPDGKILVSGCSDGRIHFWNVATGEREAILSGHRNEIRSITFSPDGQSVASLTSTSDDPIRLWDVATFSHKAILKGAFSKVSFSPDSKTLATVGWPGILLWDVATGWQKTTLEFDRGRTTFSDISFSPDGRFVFAAISGHLISWDLSSITRVSLTPFAVTSPPIGEQFSINISIVNGKNVGGYQVSLEFDHKVLRYVESANGDYLPPGAFFVPPVEPKYDITLGATSLAGVSNGDGTLATVTFEVVDIKESKLTLDGVILTDSKGDDLPYFLFHGGVSDPQIRPEDVNSDGVVNILDLVQVASRFNQHGEKEDINGDGVVNIVDLVKVAGALGAGGAAPSLHPQTLALFTAADVQKWITQAQHANLTDATSQRGILFLENLLAALTPKETALLPNYPNPFNPETWIPYQLAEPAEVTLTLYAVDGTVVRQLVLGHQPIGIYQGKGRAAYWDGRNRIGEAVASGVYFYTLTAGDFAATRKMLIRK